MAAKNGYREDETIKIPQIGEGVMAIGDLYNCVTEKSIGQNLFGQQLTGEHLVAYPQRDYDYKMTYLQSVRDKIFTLKIDVSLSVTIMSMITITGGVDFELKDNDIFHDDVVNCHMTLNSFLVQTLPAVKDVIDPVVKQLLATQTNIKATHVCTQIYVGAEADGNVAIKVTEKLDYFKIGGTLAGTATVPGVNLTVKLGTATLGFQRDVKDITTNAKITLTSKPPTLTQPTSVQQMFASMNTLPDQINKEQHFPMITTTNVVGVPLRYVLVPIKQFLPELAIRRSYLKMNVNMERMYQEMMFNLIDFQTPTFFKTQVLKGDKNLLPILEDLQNPLTKEIVEEEKSLAKVAKKLHVRASNVFLKYKDGDATAEDLEKQIDEYNEEFKIHEVYMHIQAYVNAGKKLLLGIHSTDLDEENENVKFITNSMELEEWQRQERKIKVLLLTNAKGESPGGAFLTLFKLSPSLKKLDIDVAVAYPNISKNFSLIIKAKHLECEYTQSDIEFALEILAVAVGQGKNIHSTFYTVLASLSGINLPLKQNLEDVNPLIASLKQTKNIQICPSYLNLRESISEFSHSPNESKWKFVVEVNASESVVDALHFLNCYQESMSTSLKTESEWIVGSFGLNAFYDAPLLFVFRDGELRAICLDNMDLLILQEAMDKSVRTPDLDLISPEKLTWRAFYPDRLNFALHVLELLGQHRTTLDKDTGNLESLNSIPHPIDNLEHCIRITKAALTGKPIDVFTALAVICLDVYKDEATGFSELFPVFKKSGWSDVSNCFPNSFKDIDLADVEIGARDFFKKRNPYLTIVEKAIETLKVLLEVLGTEYEDEEEGTVPVEVQINHVIDRIFLMEDCPEKLHTQMQEYYYCDSIDLKTNGIINTLDAYIEEIYNEEENSYLRALINLAAKMSVEREFPQSLIMDVVGMFVRAVASNSLLENYMGASNSLRDHLKRLNIYETVSLLSKCKWNHKLFTLHYRMSHLTNLHDVDAMTQLAIDMNATGFEKGDYFDTWQNPKFIQFYMNGLHVDRVVDCLKVYQCHQDELTGETNVSDFLPLEFQDRIRQLIIEGKKFDFVWKQEWIDENFVLTAFQSIVVRGFLPSDFHVVLQRNVTENENIKEFFKVCGILFFWSEKESLFTQPWDLFTIQKAADKINSWFAQQNVEDLIQMEIDIEQQSQDFQNTSKSLEFIESWNAVTNNSIFKVSSKKYKEISTLKNKFEKDIVRDLKNSVSRLLPFLHKNLKMFNTKVLDYEPMLDYFPYPNRDDWNQPGKIDFGFDDEDATQVPFVSRADMLNCLISTSDSSVSANILSRFSNTKYSLPLVIPQITKPMAKGIESRLLLPYLKNLPIQWQTSSQDRPQRHNLFSDPCRLIVAIRIGDHTPGKSFLLNCALYDKQMPPPPVFSSLANPNKGRPISLDGLVEFTWITEKTCGDNIWKLAQERHYNNGTNEALLLANVHGEIFNNLDILRELNKIASCFLVFVMPDSIPQLKEKAAELSQIVNKSDLYYMLIKGTNEDDLFDLPETIRELIPIFGSVFSHTPKSWSLDELEIDRPVFMPSDVQLPESKKLVKMVKIETCKGIREIMQLQKSNDIDAKGFSEIWKGSVPLQSLVSLFASILTLQPRLRNAGLAHVQQEIRILSFASTENIRKQIADLTDELRRAFTSAKSDVILNIQNQLSDEKTILSNSTLELEHFFREISRVYAVTDANLHLNYEMVNAYAEYINAGNEFEIFSQEFDSSDIMWGRWLKDTFTRSKLFREYRVFVLSVLGLTSSGKSTLLNTLFGSNFAVHDGGCTRGLHMRLVFPDAQLGEELRYDVILVIDSEGLGDPGSLLNGASDSIYKERYDNATEIKLRKLAAFVLGISDLTLLCVRGNSMYEMKSILEIAFTKLLMVGSEENILTPDLLIIHQEEFQENEAVQPVVNELKESLMAACELTENHETNCGVRVRGGRKLDKIMQRVKVNDVERSFKPFHEETDGKEPSLAYLSSTKELYREILDICKISTTQKSARKFLEWYSGTEALWKSMSTTDFPLGFWDCEEVNEYLSDRIALEDVKDAAEVAFKSHQNEMEEKMQKLFVFGEWGIHNKPERVEDNLREETLQWLKNRLNQITATCILSKESIKSNQNGETVYEELPCHPCEKVVKLKESIYKRKTITLADLEKLNQYIISIRVNILNHWTQSLTAQEMVHGKSKEFDDILRQIQLGDCWNLQIACNQTNLKRIVSLMTTVVGPSRQIEMEVTDVYANLPNIFQQLGALEELPNIENIKAFDLGYYNALKHADEVDSGTTTKKSEYLSSTQQDWLQEKIKDLPGLMRKVHQTDLYEIGFIRELQRRVEVDVLELLEKLENEKLLPDFKWQCHLYAVKIFAQQMEALQEVWDEKNQPLLILPPILEKLQN